MSAAHTPGPWKLETVPTSCGICHKIGEFPNIRRKLNGDKEPPSYACFYVDNGDGHADEMLANARLAAAAPELLEALEKVVEEEAIRTDAELAEYEANGSATTRVWAHRMIRFRAIIKLAKEGRP